MYDVSRLEIGMEANSNLKPKYYTHYAHILQTYKQRRFHRSLQYIFNWPSYLGVGRYFCGEAQLRPFSGASIGSSLNGLSVRLTVGERYVQCLHGLPTVQVKPETQAVGPVHP